MIESLTLQAQEESLNSLAIMNIQTAINEGSLLLKEIISNHLY